MVDLRLTAVHEFYHSVLEVQGDMIGGLFLVQPGYLLLHVLE